MRVFMIRPWKVAVAVVLGAAMLPSSAMAAPPTITIATPANGATYTVNQPVAANFSCVDAVDCVATDSHNAPLAQGALVDTSTVGPSYISVTAHDAAGNVYVTQSAYSIGTSSSG